jgi:hypothetical protein
MVSEGGRHLSHAVVPRGVPNVVGIPGFGMADQEKEDISVSGTALKRICQRRAVVCYPAAR